MDRDTENPRGQGLRGYLSYADTDHEYAGRLKTHLRSLAWGGQRIDFWTDAEITSGSRWYDSAVEAISTADILITCFSPDYLASEFRYKAEWPAIMRRVRESSALMVPVILRPCMWFGFVDTFQAVPLDKGRVRPVVDWRPQEAGYHQATQQIAAAVRSYFAADHKLPATIVPAATGSVAFAPASSEKLSDKDLDAAVEAVIGRRVPRGAD